MSYNVHNFEDGQILHAAPLNEMDEQISQNKDSLTDLNNDLGLFIIKGRTNNRTYYEKDINLPIVSGNHYVISFDSYDGEYSNGMQIRGRVGDTKTTLELLQVGQKYDFVANRDFDSIVINVLSTQAEETDFSLSVMKPTGDYVGSNLLRLIDRVENVSHSDNVLNTMGFVNNYYIDNVGVHVNSNTFCTTDLIPVDGDIVLGGKMVVIPAQNVFNIYGYDVNKNFVRGIFKTNTVDIAEGVIEITSDIKYITITTAHQYENNAYLKAQFFYKDVKNARDVYAHFINDLPCKVFEPILMGTPKRIKLLGDSITAGVGGTGFTDDDTTAEKIVDASNKTYYVNENGVCWANKIKAYLETNYNCVVKNYGISGATTQRITTYRNQIISSADDIIVVSIGINDRNTGLNVVEQYLKELVDFIKNQGKQVVLMSEIPVSVANDSATTQFKTFQLDNFYSMFSKKENIPYISLYKLLYNYVLNSGVTIDSLLADGLHPNDNGYDIIYKLLLSELGFAPKLP